MIVFPSLRLGQTISEVNRIWHSYRDDLISIEEMKYYVSTIDGLDNFEALELMKLMEKNKHGQVRKA